MHKEKKESATPERAPKFTFARAFLSCLKRSQNPSFLTHVVQKTRIFAPKKQAFEGGKISSFYALKRKTKAPFEVLFF